MLIFLYHFFHTATSDRTEKGLVRVPADRALWPESWKEIFYKRYSFFKSIPLPIIGRSFFTDLLSRRRSSNEYLPGNKVTLPALSYILKCGYGLQGGNAEKGREENRTVPSAGKRYPLEIYLFLFKQIGSCAAGIYHYGIKNHALEPIIFTQLTQEDISSFCPNKKWLSESAGMICITSVFSRTANKYGSRGYRYVLLEAGHVAQNMLLAGTEKKINIIPIGGIEEVEIEKILSLNNLDERVVYTLFF